MHFTEDDKMLLTDGKDLPFELPVDPVEFSATARDLLIRAQKGEVSREDVLISIHDSAQLNQALDDIPQVLAAAHIMYDLLEHEGGATYLWRDQEELDRAWRDQIKIFDDYSHGVLYPTVWVGQLTYSHYNRDHLADGSFGAGFYFRDGDIIVECTNKQLKEYLNRALDRAQQELSEEGRVIKRVIGHAPEQFEGYVLSESGAANRLQEDVF